ncbi:MAG: hypothetical protein KGR47_03075 [Acidobacteria bacterium]|nr:hypothetical protein [Acidobacteriota bacterium]
MSEPPTWYSDPEHPGMQRIWIDGRWGDQWRPDLGYVPATARSSFPPPAPPQSAHAVAPATPSQQPPPPVEKDHFWREIFGAIAGLSLISWFFDLFD